MEQKLLGKILNGNEDEVIELLGEGEPEDEEEKKLISISNSYELKVIKAVNKGNQVKSVAPFQNIQSITIKRYFKSSQALPIPDHL